MNRARDRREGTPAYEEYLRDRQAELDEEQRQHDAAAAQDPTVMYQQVANAEAEASRQLVLTGRLSDEYMSDFGAVVRTPFTEAQVEIAMAEFMAQTPDYVKTKANAKVLVEFLYRNQLSLGARTSLRLAHKILALWNCYPDAEKPVQEMAPAPVVEAAPVLSRSEQAILDHQKFMEEIVGTDELGKQWTAFELDRLPAIEELRLRRLFEQGHRGSNLLTVRREVLDIKQQQDAERDRIAQEEER
jgi:hypothetical protein